LEVLLISIGLLVGGSAFVFLGLQATSWAWLPVQRLHIRLRVVVPCFALALLLASALGVLAGHGLLCVAPLAGPFIAPVATPNYQPIEMALHGTLTLLCIGAHPAWPHPITGLVTALGVGWWFLVGLATTYSGV